VPELAGPGLTEDYGYAYDGHCKYAGGDYGYLFTIDPVTGGSPCSLTEPGGLHASSKG